MDKLLKWSIDASKSDGKTPVDAPDPKLLNQLFGGKDEATMMRECMIKILNKQHFDFEQRMVAFDDLEMLVESLDNANNLKPLQMWEPLVGLLDEYKSKDEKEGEKEDSEEQRVELTKMAAWVIGTAAQNNGPAQDQALEIGDGAVIDKLIKLASASSPTSSSSFSEMSVKALYALSSLVGHNQTAYRLFHQFNGWALFPALLGSSSTVSEKVKQRAFGLLHVLVTNEGADPATRHGHVAQSEVLVHAASTQHIGKEANANTRDRALAFLDALCGTQYKFGKEEKQDIQKVVDDLKKDGILEKDDYEMLQQI